MSDKAAPGAFLFTGHMIDRPGRLHPRFPPRLEAAAGAAIAAALRALAAEPGDLAISSAAAGGDILFAEAALVEGMRPILLLPFPVGQFLARSVEPSGPAWRERFTALAEDSRCSITVLPPVPKAENPYAACNEAILERALASGTRQVHCIALWNAEPGDGPGGTGHLVAAAERAGIPVFRIDPRTLPEVIHGSA